MNWDVVEGNWEQLKGKIREKWGKFTDNDLTVIGGKKDRFLGLLQEKYGYQKDRALNEIDSFFMDYKQDYKNIDTKAKH